MHFFHCSGAQGFHTDGECYQAHILVAPSEDLSFSVTGGHFYGYLYYTLVVINVVHPMA